jgi:RNA polymerase sigma-70 factor (sigma-E family)
MTLEMGWQVREPDRQDFEQFARARTPELMRAAWLLCGDRYAAEDLVQDTLARLYSRWSRVRRADNPVAYARTVLTRLFIDGRRRRRSGERPVEHLPEVGRRDPDTDLRRTLVDALGRLGEVDRAVVVLRFLLDLDVETVATTLELTGQAVRSRTSRALGRLRDQLGEELGAGFPVPTTEGAHL